MRYALLLFALCHACAGGGERAISSTVTLDLSETVQRGQPPQLWLTGSVIDPTASACAYLDYDFAQLPGELRVGVRGVVDSAPCPLDERGSGAAFRQLLDASSLELRSPLHVSVRGGVDSYDLTIAIDEVDVSPQRSPAVTAFPDTSWRRVPGGFRWWFARVNQNTLLPIDPTLLDQFDALLTGAGCIGKPLAPGRYKALGIVADENGAIYQAAPGQPPDSIRTYVIGGAASGTLVQAVNAFRQAHDAAVWIYLGDEAGLIASF